MRFFTGIAAAFEMPLVEKFFPQDFAGMGNGKASGERAYAGIIKMKDSLRRRW
jgi:hypothetical protein